MHWLGKRGMELLLAFALLTRLPLPAPPTASATAVRGSVWAYPIAGLVVGMLAAGAFGLASWAGLPAAMSAMLTLAATAILTGCLHEDGLADCADGLGGGRTPQRKLEIMRDSRIGTYGVVALMLSFGLRWSALTALALPAYATPALIVTHATARGLVPVLLLALQPARRDGLGLSAARPPLISSVAAIVLAIAVPLVLWPLEAALLAIAAALGVMALVGWIAERQIGGFTGDVLGAGEQMAEIALLCVAAALLA